MSKISFFAPLARYLAARGTGIAAARKINRVRKVKRYAQFAAAKAPFMAVLGHKRKRTSGRSWSKVKRPARRRTMMPSRGRFLRHTRGYRRYRRTYTRKRRVMGRRTAEKKRITLEPAPYVQPAPTQIPGVSAVYGVLGPDSATPVAWNTTGFSPALAPNLKFLDGISIPQDLSQSGRIGSRTYLMHTSMKMSIVVDPKADKPGLPIDFRVVVVKVRRDQSAQAWVGDGNGTISPFTQMFWRTNGRDWYGPETQNVGPVYPFWPLGEGNPATGNDGDYINTIIQSRALLNKNKVKVYCDKRFRLGPPSISGTTEYPNIPIQQCHKNLYFKLRHNKRAMYYPYAPSQVLPTNYEWRYVTMVFASYANSPSIGEAPETEFISPDNFHVNMSGQTLYTDV